MNTPALSTSSSRPQRIKLQSVAGEFVEWGYPNSGPTSDRGMPMASPKFPILVIGFPWQNLRDRQPFNAESFLPPIADRGSHGMGDSDSDATKGNNNGFGRWRGAACSSRYLDSRPQAGIRAMSKFYFRG
jgi:hypothetical protein